MADLILVPYNESMRLGQGYNSFLQTRCVYDAMQTGEGADPDGIVDETGGNGLSSGRGTSQVVTYSSRFVTKVSDVVNSMNISAGASVKNGGISVSGKFLNLDELKFTESDLNVLVSVKVINQQTEVSGTAEFIPPTFELNSDKFHQFYGDCHISGFIEGGELHGVVSVKALDPSKKEEIKTA